MMVRIEDHDFDPDDLIDIVLFNEVISPGSGWTNSRNLNGFYNAATLSGRFRVFCHQNYYGSNCLTLCVATNNSQGHYTCNSNGQKVCLSGWTNVGNADNCLTRKEPLPTPSVATLLESVFAQL